MKCQVSLSPGLSAGGAETQLVGYLVFRSTFGYLGYLEYITKENDLTWGYT
jgi:hypothetical protein